uniref:TITAN-like protein n=1 Tax=Kalanchoe fedtschenkoi TaxID=63787 RepID=A0A7N0VF46_KALFE
MKKRKTSAAAAGDFEFCKVCNRHHQDGKRHKYFPKHLTSLSSFLARFQSKLSDVCFFLKNPTVLLPQHASQNRLWCVFCDSDIDEIGSSFACSKAIRHLASDDHLKSWKSFLWKNGGGMDQVDSFVISEPELAEWERKCNMLPKEASSSSEASKAGASIYGPSNDIHNQTDSIGFNNSVDYFTISTHGSNSSSGVVMPLHRYTNENHQVWASHMDQTVSFESGYHQNSVTSASQPGVQHALSSSGLKHNADCQSLQQMPLVSVEDMGNVHTGAPPPWLEPICNEDLVQGSRATLVKPSSQMSKKSRKLNPKRVGAAWAEKRKIEIELEKRGEVSAEKIDESWLPNFGRVWQAGSRKDSKKEFEMEKQNVAVLSQSEMPIDIQPYVSKRMRTDGTSIG